MVEAGNVLGVLAAVLLLMAVIAWVKLIRGPLMQRMDGHTSMDPSPGRVRIRAAILGCRVEQRSHVPGRRRVDLQLGTMHRNFRD